MLSREPTACVFPMLCNGIGLHCVDISFSCFPFSRARNMPAPISCKVHWFPPPLSLILFLVTPLSHFCIGLTKMLNRILRHKKTELRKERE